MSTRSQVAVVDPADVPTTAARPAGYTDADWHLDPDTLARLVESVPPNTRRAYAWALREYTSWCAATRRVALPATTETATAYVDFLIEILALSPATIEQALGAIRGAHRRRGHPGQPDTVHALDLLRLYKRKRAVNGIHQKQSTPFTEDTLIQCIDTLDLDTLAGRRDQMALVFGFRMMARRHVLSGLRHPDITIAAEGLDVWVRADKTDPESEGRICSLPPQRNPLTDSVTVLHAWRDQLAAARFPVDDGPLIPRFAKGWRTIRGPLSGHGINAVVHQVAHNADLPDPDTYTAHGLRAGGLMHSLLRGVPAGVAARHGGWDPESPMLGRYARLANRWQGNAMSDAL